MTALAWEGCLNVRDLGGLPTEDGRRTRAARCRPLRQRSRGCTDAGWRALAEHGVTRIVDLRWPEELAEDQPRDVDIDVVHVSVLGESYDRGVRRRARRASGVRRRRRRPLRLVVRRLPRALPRRASAARSRRSPTPTAPSSSTAWAARTAPGSSRRSCCGSRASAARRSARTTRSPPPTSRRAERALARETQPTSAEREKRRRLTHDARPRRWCSVVEEIERRYGDVASYLRAAGLDGRADRPAAGATCRSLSCAASRRATARSARCTT